MASSRRKKNREKRDKTRIHVGIGVMTLQLVFKIEHVAYRGRALHHPELVFVFTAHRNSYKMPENAKWRGSTGQGSQAS